MAILNDVRAELEALRAENARLKAQAQAKIKLKVSEKGCVQILGLHSKWGLTLYPETVLKVLDMGQELRAFIEANRSALSWKN